MNKSYEEERTDKNEYLDEKDFESDFENVDVHNYENEKENKVYQENFISKIGNLAKQAFALDKREEFENNSDYIWNHMRHNGIWGVIEGTFKSLAAIIGETVHVLVSNVIMGQHERFDFGRAVSRALNEKNIKEEGKRKKNQLKENETNNKEERQKDREKKNKRNNKEEDMNHQKESKQEKAEYVPEPENDLIQEIEQHICEPEKVLDEKTIEILNTKENVNLVIDACIQESSFQNIFQELNILPVNDRNSNNIFLFSQNKEMDIERIVCVDKEDLLKGNAETLGTALYQYNRTNDTQEEKLESVIEAVISTAKIQNMIHKDEYDCERKNMAIEEHKAIIVSSMAFDTEDNTKAFLAAILAEPRDSVDIYYNNNLLGTIDITDPINAHCEQLQSKILEAQNLYREMIYQLDQDVSFVKENNYDVTVVANGESRSFHLEEENDMKDIADYLEEKCPDNKESATLNALLIGATINPMLKRSVDEYGFEINPFTGNKKQSGDLFIEHKNNLVYISQYHLNKIPTQNATMQIREENKQLVRLKPYGLPMDFHQMRECLKKVDVQQENILNEYVQPIKHVEHKQCFDQPLCADGHASYEELKERSITDNFDISFLNFTQKKEIIEDKEERPEKNNYQSYESFAQEMEEQIQSYESMDISAFNQTGFTIPKEIQEEYTYER